MACGIYKITNLINGKVYIGQSINIEERWREHKKKPYQENSEEYNYPLYQAIRKYGLDSFKFEVIEECLPEDLNQKEEHYISLYESYPPDKGKGYNQTPGGNSGSGFKKLTINSLKEIVNLLKNSNLSRKAIAEQYNISEVSLSNINNGIQFYNDKLQYPLRVKVKAEYKNYCIICGKEIHKQSTLCKKCAMKQREIPIPPKEEILKSFYKLKNCQKVADKFNISTILLKRWRKELNLPEKVKDIIELYEKEYLGIVKEERIKNPNYMVPIKQIDKNTEEIIQIFENPTQAVKYIQENYQPNNKFENISMCIHNCLKGQIKIACGFKWSYLKI